MTSRKRSSKKKTSPQSSSGNPCTNEEIVPKEEFEVEQEEKEAYWDALCDPSGVLQSSEQGCVSSPVHGESAEDPSEGFFTCYEAFLTRCRVWFPIPEAIVRALDRFELSISQQNVVAMQKFLGVLILSYELGMDLSPDDFEWLWSTRKTSIDYSYRMDPKRHMSIIQGHTSNGKGCSNRWRIRRGELSPLVLWQMELSSWYDGWKFGSYRYPEPCAPVGVGCGGSEPDSPPVLPALPSRGFLLPLSWAF
ncbi:hypothetical protein F2Q70_00026576 [Brassica cretica]|uniref:Uncharacterized protein n=1 Tax=Brassica cretica TaxID=69181 RepID=A0A8S9LAP7_BRACR|nr:hypothetical protein F2Q70_00026576 [Brassica cretica]